MKKLFILITIFYFKITLQKFDFNKYSKKHDFKNPFEDNEKQILLTIGTLSNYKVIQIGSGTLGIMWGRPVLYAFLKPTKEIKDFFEENLYYSVSFFNKKYKNIFLENKIKETFHPIEFNVGVSFEEAEESFLMQKTYSHIFDSKKIPTKIRKDYEEGKYGHLELPDTEYIGIIGDHFKKKN